MSSTRNKTTICSADEMSALSKNIMRIDKKTELADISNQIIKGDIFSVGKMLPEKFVDLLILDPPYNLSKDYNGLRFKEKKGSNYSVWFKQMLKTLSPILKPTTSIYVCADWKTSVLIAPILKNFFHIQNRITWEREKGRGAKANWKNNTEDIWFCTQSNDYYFDVEAVKLKKKVIAPYKVNGKPKDWTQEANGNYRLTYPSNIWTDLTVPFWSMPENTWHPTQKPEKLLAKLILASSQQGDFIFDPFLGSGTTAVVAKKLERQFCGIEINQEYCCWALKRLEKAGYDTAIQGYTDSVFWERNSLSVQKKAVHKRNNKRNYSDESDILL